MNQKNGKNSLGLDSCFEEADNPIDLFKKWFSEAEKSEINDPNAVAVATSDKDNQPNVRMDGSADRGELMALYNHTGTNAYVGFELRGKANGANDSAYPKWSVMALSVCGMYDDTNKKWGMLCRPNAEVELYYNANV